MKFVSSKLLQKAEGRRIGKYLLTVELTDTDIERFEEFSSMPTAVVKYDVPEKRYDKMNDYLKKLFHNVFQRLWRDYDD